MTIVDRVVRSVADAGGILHRGDLRAAGYSDSAIRSAAGSGRLVRIRSAWFATPDAPADMRRAATVGGRLTCVSATSRLGLWTPTHTSGHIAVPANRAHIDASGLTLHWGTPPMPVRRGQLIDPLLNVLFHVARCCQPREALAVWESAVRHGRTTRETLARVEWGAAATAVTRLLLVLSVLSDSGVETHLVDRLRPFGLPLRQQIWIAGHRVDVLIGQRLVVQIDGFAHHSDSAQRRSDIRHDAELALMGYTVLRFDYAQIMFDWPLVEATVLAAVAQRKHLAT